MTVVWFVLGCAVGGVIAWLIRGSSRSDRAAAEARVAAREAEVVGLREGIAAKDRLIEEKMREVEALRTAAERRHVWRLEDCWSGWRRNREAAEREDTGLVDVEKSLKTSFQALAGEALDANSKRLVALAKGELDKQQMESAKELAAKESAIEKLLKPMQESLAKLSTHSQDLEVKREGAYREVLAEIQNMQKSHRDLRKETTQLVAALRAPQVRGNWGADAVGEVRRVCRDGAVCVV